MLYSPEKFWGRYANIEELKTGAVSPEQPPKAPEPMEVTLDGIVVFWHPKISSLVDVFIIALQLSLESYTSLFASTFIFVTPLQPPKAPEPMEVTLDGIVMLVSPVQLSKAPEPMEVTLEGMEMLVSPVHLLNAEEPIEVTLDGIVTLVRPEQP